MNNQNSTKAVRQPPPRQHQSWHQGAVTSTKLVFVFLTASGLGSWIIEAGPGACVHAILGVAWKYAASDARCCHLSAAGDMRKHEQGNPDETGVSVRTEGRQPRSGKEQDIPRAVREH